MLLAIYKKFLSHIENSGKFLYDKKEPGNRSLTFPGSALPSKTIRTQNVLWAARVSFAGNNSACLSSTGGIDRSLPLYTLHLPI